MAIAMQYGNGANIAQRLAGGGGSGGITMALLWTNPDPTAAFAAQTISLDLSEYDAVVVTSRHTGGNNVGASQFCKKGTGAQLLATYNVTSATGYINSRNFSMDDTGVVFNASYRRAYNSTTAATASGNYCIPTYIYGIKGIT